MSMNSAIMSTFAQMTGIQLTNEMNLFMTTLAFASYIGMIYLFFTTILDIVKLYKIKKKGDVDE